MAPVPNEDENAKDPLTALIAVGAGDREALDDTLRDIAENALRRDVHVRLVAPGDPLDFVGALKEIRSRHPAGDVVVITPGAQLPFAWDERLRKAAYASPDIGVAAPMCAVSPLYALVDEAARPVSRADAVLIDRTAYTIGNRSYYEIPRVHPVCAYLRHDAVDAALSSLDGAHPQIVLDAMVRHHSSLGRSVVICD